MKKEHERIRNAYEPRVRAAREQVLRDEAIREILNKKTSPKLLEGFLIQFSALGVQMTEPVDKWISRAGQRCVELGHAELGNGLIRHSSHEAGHHKMMLEDAERLTKRWNEKYEPKLVVAPLVAQPPTDSMKDYIELHESVIRSDHPFAQIAIEYEIEGLSVSLGPKLVGQLKRKLGDDIASCMSFIEEHVALDVGHTAYNERELEAFLAKNEDAVEVLADTGSKALEAYTGFLGDCLRIAKQELIRA